jgi:16S rRNA (guanine527-N7)-methyltransferase
MVFVSHETETVLREFQKLFEKWNSKINLVSKSEDIWNRHILDSLQLVKYVPHETVLVDIGSGGGFPGIILSIAGVKNVNLVESDRRKCQFLEEAKIKFSLDCKIHNDRIENINLGKVGVITSRAFSSIENIFDLSNHLINSDTIYFLHKTDFSNKELDNATKKWSFHVEQFPSVTSPTHCILKISGVKRYE